MQLAHEVLPRWFPGKSLSAPQAMKTSAAEWKDGRGLRHQGGLQWQGSDTSLKRSLRSCGRSTFWSRRGKPWRTQSARSGVSEVTYYRWRQEFGGLKSEQVKRLKDLELENSRLRKVVSDLTLDKLILQEAARGNF